jgi:hypothetical protein
MKFDSRKLVAMSCLLLLFTLLNPILVSASDQPAPTNITATAKYVPATSTTTAKKGIEVRWTASSLAEKYDIFRASVLTGTYVKVRTVSAPTTSYFDTSIVVGVTYYYYVQAYHTPLLSSPHRSPYTSTVTASFVSVSKLSANSISYTPMIGGAPAKINVTVLPNNATYKTLNFVSSNPNVCNVSSNGTLTGKIPGTATITITSIESPTVKTSVQCIAKIEPILAPTVFKTNKVNVPVWSQPSTTSTKRLSIVAMNTGVVIIERTVNSAGNIWLKTHSGNWIFDGNLSLYKYQINTKDVRQNENPTSTTKVFREQLVDGSTCTLASYANLMRRYEIIYKSTVTLLNENENYFKKFAWGENGLIWNTTVDIFTPKVVVNRVGLSGDVSSKKAKLIEYLKTRPEGILVFSRNASGEGKHMVLLTDYDSKTDTFYMYDPIAYASLDGRLKLTQAKIYGITQNDKISHIFAVWIITSPTNTTY